MLVEICVPGVYNIMYRLLRVRWGGGVNVFSLMSDACVSLLSLYAWRVFPECVAMAACFFL